MSRRFQVHWPSLHQQVSDPVVFIAGAIVGAGVWLACASGDREAMSRWQLALVEMVVVGAVLLTLSRARGEQSMWKRLRLNVWFLWAAMFVLWSGGAILLTRSFDVAVACCILAIASATLGQQQRRAEKRFG